MVIIYLFDFIIFLQRKGRRGFEGQLLATHRMVEAQHGGMQVEMRGGGLGFGRGIEVIAQYGVTELHHMYPQLVGASGDGFELHQAAILLHLQTDIVGDGPTAMLEVHLLARAVLPVDA